MVKKISIIIGIFLLGALGGFCFQVFVLPYLINIPSLQNFQFVKNLKERKVVVNPTEEVIIRENNALEEAAERVKKSVVAVKAVDNSTGETLEGAGFVLTSDGMIITLAELLPQGSDFQFFIEGKSVAAKLTKADDQANLALLKVEKDNFKTLDFANLNKAMPGEKVFLVGKFFSDQKLPQTLVNEGIIRSFAENQIQTTIIEKDNCKGTPLFNIDGDVLGLNLITKNGQVITVPVNKIKSFAGL